MGIDSRVNPFRLPGWPPMRPLCPWQDEGHRAYYVSVDSMESAYQDFVLEMDDLTALLREGQLVLVTGDTGCGKTALVNRCADWARQQVLGLQMTGEVVDLTAKLKGRRPDSIADRMALVCKQLFLELNRRNLLRPDAAEDLRGLAQEPDSVYPYLAEALVDGVVLIVLLPKIELIDEVLQYATYATAKVLFLIESSELDENDAAHIVGELEQWVPPITLHVGELCAGDARRFAAQRLRQHASLGPFPGLEDQAVDSAEEMITSIGELHRMFHSAYEAVRRGGAPYDASEMVTLPDIVKVHFGSLRGGGRDRSG